MAKYRYNFPTRPRANPEAVVQGPNYRFTVLTDGLLRYEWAPDDQFEDRASVFAINREQPVPDFRQSIENGLLHIRTARFHLVHDGTRFAAHSLSVQVLGALTEYHSVWRYGEPDEDGNLGGTARTLDNVDGRVALGPGVVSRRGFASIDDSESLLFAADGWIAARRAGTGADRVDGYLFAYGHDYKAAVRALYALSGPQPVVPRWLLGNWWSRYHAYSADDYLALMDRFRAEGIPLSVAVIDMDWHWVRAERVQRAGKSGWTGYSWNTDLFPDPEGFMKALHDRGLKTTMNDHPADGVASYEDVYEEVAAAIGHDTSNKDPIDFDITDRKYCDAYFDIVQRRLQATGMDFTWTDWQSGPHSRAAGVDPLWVLNHYTFLDNRTKNAHAPVLFSRFAGPGSHRYPVGFSGDAVVTWESLAFQPEFTATASNIGYGWWSHDIGGHMPGYKDGELFARWVQLGAFSPILRLHSTASRWMSKEPWLYGCESFAAVKTVMRLRHQLVPYLHAMSIQGAGRGEPLVQPVYWAWPDRDEAYQFKNSYFFGTELFVAPITTPMHASTNMGSTQAWLPPGRYADIMTGVVYEGDRILSFHRPLKEIPVFAKAGAVFPLDSLPDEDEDCVFGTAESGELIIVVVSGADGLLHMVERVESTSFTWMTVEFNSTSGTLTIKKPPLTEPFRLKSLQLRFIGLDLTAGSGKRDFGLSALVGTKLTMTSTGSSLELKSFPEGDIVIELGETPVLQTIDLKAKLESLVQDAQIRFQQKDQIWNAVTADVPLATKISRVEAIGLDEAMKGAVLELLWADPSR